MSRYRHIPPVPQDPWDTAREPGDIAREPGDIAREPWDTAREPWDTGWRLPEDQEGEPRDSRAQPPLGWGSPLVTKDTLLDHHHQLQGTWTQEPVGAEGEDLGARRELAHLLAIPQEVEPSRQYPVSAFNNRTLGRSETLPRSARKARGRPGHRTVLVPWMYAPVFYQAHSSPAEWSRQTPVSGGTGLKLTSDYPPASTGWYDQFNQQWDRQTRKNGPTYDWPETCEGRVFRRRLPARKFTSSPATKGICSRLLSGWINNRIQMYRSKDYISSKTFDVSVGRRVD